MKQYILIRTDKKFPIGKIMAHCAHNCLSALLEWEGVFESWSTTWSKWYYEDDQKKIVVEGGDEFQIATIVKQAIRENIPHSYVVDVNTQQRICAVIGPVTDEESYHLGLADLKLYKDD